MRAAGGRSATGVLAVYEARLPKKDSHLLVAVFLLIIYLELVSPEVTSVPLLLRFLFCATLRQSLSVLPAQDDQSYSPHFARTQSFAILAKC